MPSLIKRILNRLTNRQPKQIDLAEALAKAVFESSMSGRIVVLEANQVDVFRESLESGDNRTVALDKALATKVESDV